MKTALIAGGTGFIGHHMARRLKSEGYYVRVVDIKPYEYGVNDFADEVLMYDLRNPLNVESVLRLDTFPNDNINQDPIILPFNYLPTPFSNHDQFDEVYLFACQMGGAGYVFAKHHDADILHDSALINLNFAYFLGHGKFKGKIFYSSSACMYPQELQIDSDSKGLRESDAYPLNPDSDYGLEKAFSERLFLAYARNYGLNVRIARFHNIYGPEGTYQGGREKAPAAMCRKVIEAKLPNIKIWGDGKQTRSFLYINDCIDAVRLLMKSDFREPINIGSEEMVSINELVDIITNIAGRGLFAIDHEPGPIGVRGRNSDNTLIRKVLLWEPKYSLKEGLEKTFNWIQSRYNGL